MALLTKSKGKRNLVYTYQILPYLELDGHTYTHLSVCSEDQKSFCTYPFGIRFNEMNENSLMKVSFDGSAIEGKEYQYNRTGYVIHGFIIKQRRTFKQFFACIHLLL